VYPCSKNNETARHNGRLKFKSLIRVTSTNVIQWVSTHPRHNLNQWPSTVVQCQHCDNTVTTFTTLRSYCNLFVHVIKTLLEGWVCCVLCLLGLLLVHGGGVYVNFRVCLHLHQWVLWHLLSICLMSHAQVNQIAYKSW